MNSTSTRRNCCETHLDTVDDEQLLLLVDVPLVPRVHPPVLERLRSSLRVVQVPERHARARHDQVARLVEAAPRAVGLEDTARGARDEPAGRPWGADTHVKLREGEGGTGLGHAVALADSRVLEHFCDLVRELGRERRCAGGHKLDAAEVVILHCWMLEERTMNGGLLS